VKYLLLFLILSVGLGLLYLRLRPYLRFAREVFGVFRAAQRGEMPPLGREGTLPGRKPATAANQLTRCAACGAWSAQSVKLGAQNFCSHQCLEKVSARR
jgi:hypothetical protein